VDFNGYLFRKEKTIGDCVVELMQGLPQLSVADRSVLDATISIEELTLL